MQQRFECQGRRKWIADIGRTQGVSAVTQLLTLERVKCRLRADEWEPFAVNLESSTCQRHRIMRPAPPVRFDEAGARVPLHKPAQSLDRRRRVQAMRRGADGRCRDIGVRLAPTGQDNVRRGTDVLANLFGIAKRSDTAAARARPEIIERSQTRGGRKCARIAEGYETPSR